jgi:hypothetical protein
VTALEEENPNLPPLLLARAGRDHGALSRAPTRSCGKLKSEASI